MEKDKVEVTIKVTGDKSDLVKFLQLCGLIQHLGKIGASRNIDVFVDGDGSARLGFKAVEGDKEHEIPVPKIDYDNAKIGFGV